MELTDEYIVTLDREALFSQETFLSLFDIHDPKERARVAALLSIKAEEYGKEKKFEQVLKAWTKAEDKLKDEYNIMNADKYHYGIHLDHDAAGRPMATIDNFLQILEKDPKFKGLKFNLLTYCPEQEREEGCVRWEDSDDAETRRYIESVYKIHSAQKCDDALRIVFKKNEYHPIRDLIDSFEWDGKDRISQFLHFAAKCEDSSYTREVSRLIFAGGIHRLYEPGCKFDDMPVLIGTKQGEGKSTLIRWIALKDEYFTEVNEFEGERAMQALEGAWICEVSELLAMTKTKEQEAVKAFLTRMNDRRKIPYDRRVTDHLRQCIFIGTTNKEQFLTDKTGNRRFYPVKVNQRGYEMFDRKDEIQEYIRQCWAEAKAKYNDTEMQPYAKRELLGFIQVMQEEAVEDDYRVGMIADYLEGRYEVCILELWQKALDMGDYVKPTKKDSIELGLIMQNFDSWEKQPNPKRFNFYGQQRWWQRIE